MNFEEVLMYRKKYPIYTAYKDALCDAVIKGTYKCDYAIMTIGIVNMYSKELLKDRYIDIIIQIPSPFVLITTNFMLIHFTKNRPLKILTGVFKGVICKREYKELQLNGKFQVMGKTTEDFNDFLNNINSFNKNGFVNRNDLIVNDYSIFDPNYLNPYYYTKQAIKIRRELQDSDYVLLKNIADIISTPTDNNITGKYIDSKSFIYPLKYENLPTGIITRAIKLKKGDIVGLLVGEKPKFYLYNNDYNDIYIKAGNYHVIRVKDKKINNYLVTYLNDEKARMYFASVKRGSIIPILSKNDFCELKVIIPTLEMIKMADGAMEYTMNSKKLSPYEINELIRASYKAEYENESQKMINEDILSAISKMKNKAIRELINDDLNEVGICFDNKAYKSAIILCGSILEAILLDWLSEFENTNDILQVAKDEEGKDLELGRIITKLKEVVRPYWYESQKAHDIRKTRNMVHPKECIKNHVKVNAEECKRIINDLNEIIESKESRS